MLVGVEAFIPERKLCMRVHINPAYVSSMEWAAVEYGAAPVQSDAEAMRRMLSVAVFVQCDALGQARVYFVSHPDAQRIADAGRRDC